MAKQEEITEPIADEKPSTETLGKDKQINPKRLLSLSEYAANTKREDITETLQAGFRMWMQTAKNEPLRARTDREWNKLFDEYLKS